MISLPILHTHSAQHDISAILLHLLEESPTAAVELQAAIDATIQQLSKSPSIGEVYHHATIGELRRVLVSHYSSYSVYYRAATSEVVIVRVIHNSRDLNSSLATPLTS